MARSRRSSKRPSPLQQRLAELPARVLTAAGLGRCAGCDFASFETVEEAVRELGLDPRRVARSLAAAAAKEGRR